MTSDSPLAFSMTRLGAARLARLLAQETPDVTRALTRVPTRLQGIVVAGLDAGLEARLRALAAGSAVQVLGHAANVRQLMAASDPLVTKAGGMTLAETIAAGLALVTYGSLPGQERRNARFAARCGVALVARSRRELHRALERSLTEPDLLERLRRRMSRMRRPGASRRVVSVVLEREEVAP